MRRAKLHGGFAGYIPPRTCYATGVAGADGQARHDQPCTGVFTQDAPRCANGTCCEGFASGESGSWCGTSTPGGADDRRKGSCAPESRGIACGSPVGFMDILGTAMTT